MIKENDGCNTSTSSACNISANPDDAASHRRAINPDFAIKIAYLLDVTFMEALQFLEKLDIAGMELKWKPEQM